MKNWLKYCYALAFILVTSCHSKIEPEKLSKIIDNEVIVFEEVHDENSSEYSFEFCDIVVLDLETSQKYKFTNDHNIDEYPILSENREGIIFKSARSKTESIRRIQGASAERQLYKFTFNSRKILLDNSIDWDRAHRVFRLKGDSVFIFQHSYLNKPLPDSVSYTDANYISILNVNNKNLRTIKKYNLAKHDPRYIMLSPDQNYLVVNCYRHLHIYDLMTDYSKEIETPEGVFLSGFDTESEKFLYSSKNNEYTEYYIRNDLFKQLILPQNDFTFIIHEPIYYTKEGNLIGLAANDTTLFNHDKVDVMLYDIVNKQYKMLTNDGLQKFELKYYPTKEE